MNNVTLVSYPAAKNNSLLSLTNLRSKYMLPFAAKYRVVDFVLRNAVVANFARAIIFSDVLDDLECYLNNHPVAKGKTLAVHPVLYDDVTVDNCYDMFKNNPSDYYIIYNGDTPSYINFNDLYRKYLKKRTNTVLYKFIENGVPKMSHTILITNKKSLMSVLRDIKKKKIHAPNIFEMLNNMLIHQGVSYSSYHADLWYLRNIPEYYDVNMSFFKSRELFDKIFKDTSLVSGIIPNEITFIGMYGDVKNSFIAEGCFVNGVLENSICFPGAIIAEKSVVRDSIILPFAAIGKKTNLTRVILDEFTDYSNSDRLYNIGDSCRIGTSMDNLKNNDFPKSLFNGITLVGKNCRIPDSVTVGGGCFISSATDSSSFTRVKTIDDGLSIIQTEGIL